jgi:MoaA/NifB/PqqE/SkfB family radical SAM enzyme
MSNMSPPYLVSYAITRKCNLKCKHCYSDAVDAQAPDELSTSEAKKLLDTLADWGIQLLIFDGGELLCRGDFFEEARSPRLYSRSKFAHLMASSRSLYVRNE